MEPHLGRWTRRDPLAQSTYNPIAQPDTNCSAHIGCQGRSTPLSNRRSPCEPYFLMSALSTEGQPSPITVDFNLYMYSSLPLVDGDPLGLCLIKVQCCPMGTGTIIGCNRNCRYKCTEISRKQTTGGVLCDDIPKGYITYEHGTIRDWACECLGTDPNPGPCKKCYTTSKLLMDTYWDFNCSNSACHQDCSDIFDIAEEACRGNRACIALAKAARFACDESCDAFCRQP